MMKVFSIAGPCDEDKELFSLPRVALAPHTSKGQRGDGPSLFSRAREKYTASVKPTAKENKESGATPSVDEPAQRQEFPQPRSRLLIHHFFPRARIPLNPNLSKAPSFTLVKSLPLRLSRLGYPPFHPTQRQFEHRRRRNQRVSLHHEALDPRRLRPEHQYEPIGHPPGRKD